MTTQLLPLPAAEPQAMFDFALASMRLQGCPSLRGGDSTSCRYRGKGKSGETLACVVGHFIKDEDYLPEFEDRRVSGSGSRSLMAALGEYVVREPRVGLMSRMQWAHDEVDLGDEWLRGFEVQMRTVALVYGLNFTEATP